jgi:hypothetical protein
MRKAIAATLSAAVVASSMLSPVAQAAPRHHGDRDRFISSYCERHPRDRDCNDWRSHRNRWSDDRYDRWYHNHRRDFGPGDAAASIFGFAAGAIAGAAAGAASGASDGSHVARCEARYKSYNASTDMFMGYDGQYHRCDL